MFLEEILIRVQESKDTKLNIFFQKNRRKWVVLLGFNSTRCLMFRFARSFARTFSFYFPHTINTPSVKKKNAMHAKFLRAVLLLICRKRVVLLAINYCVHVPCVLVFVTCSGGSEPINFVFLTAECYSRSDGLFSRTRCPYIILFLVHRR